MTTRSGSIEDKASSRKGREGKLEPLPSVEMVLLTSSELVDCSVSGTATIVLEEEGEKSVEELVDSDKSEIPRRKYKNDTNYWR